MESELYHYGTPRHSGRYPFGSGDNPYQHNEAFLRGVLELKEKGMSEKDIATEYGFDSINSLRARISAANNENRKINVSKALELYGQGLSKSEIAREMGTNESTIRGWLKQADVVKENKTDQTMELLRNAVAEKKYIDVGTGTEYQLGISEDKLKKCVKLLQDEEGYSVTTISTIQLGTGEKTNIKVLAAPGVERSEISKNREDISVINQKYNEETRQYEDQSKIRPMQSIDGDRVAIRYPSEGGAEMDGVIQIRKGVADLDLGDSKYAQVRILVDDNKYLKGMAMYSDDIPDGKDIIFNTSKPDGTPFNKVLKSIDSEADMQKVLATIKKDGQRDYTDENGVKHQSAINIHNEEGDWDTWSKSLASQMLSKQPVSLISRQLKLTSDEKESDLEDILSLTNPEIKKTLLWKYAEECDADAVSLKATSLPRQSCKVILPITSLKDNEVYAPGYKDGETVVLVRYPHGGRFEMPELTVNNKNAQAKSLIFNAADAIGINSKVAAKLSGADFDGDTVVVIPNNNHAIKNAPTLKALEDFSPSERYPKVEGMKQIKTSRQSNMEMGKISNLITDMTIKGATSDELGRAVKHSMVVIDAKKHELNYKQSEIDNGIAELKKKYQNQGNGRYGGASTLISKAGSDVRDIDERSKYTKVDPDTGELIYKNTGRTYVNKAGKVVKAKTTSTKMAETKDAHTLSSGTEVEEIYANYANKMKSLANRARKEWYYTKSTETNSSAKDIYKEEIKSLDAKLEKSKANAPYERQAQIKGNAMAKRIISANDDLSSEDKRKIKGRCLQEARNQVGSTKYKIEITPKEWEAIESGAISSSKIMSILNNTNTDAIRQYATPKTKKTTVSTSKISVAKAMNASGFSLADIAERIGVSTSTVSGILNGTVSA